MLIRTGWSQFFSHPKQFVSAVEGTPGINESGARWLLEQGMGLAGGDTIAFALK